MSQLGLALLITGFAALYFGGSFDTKREGLALGAMQGDSREHRSIMPWIATTALLAGTVLVLVGGGTARIRERA